MNLDSQFLGLMSQELYRRGEFPIPVLRIGTRLRVSLVQLGRFLEGGSDAA